MPTQSPQRWKQARPVPALALLIASLLLLLVSLTLGLQPAQAARAEAHDAAPVHQSRALLLPRLLDQTRAPSTERFATSAAQHSSPPGNFPFKTVQSADGLLVIHYYNRPENLAQGYIAQARQSLQHPVHDTLGFSLTHRVDIYLYGSRQDFLAGAPVTNPAETDALTDPVHNTIYLDSADQGDFGGVNALPHELTHIVFHQNEDSGHLEGPYFSFYPRWLDEGLAAYDEPPNSPYTRSYDDALAKAVAAHHPVDILQQFVRDYPTDPDTDYLAYAESRSFIAYLITSYGSDTFHSFLVDARDGQLLLDAQQHFGADLRILESRWEVSLGLPPTVPDQGFAPVPPKPLATTSTTPLSPLASQTQPFFVREPLDATLPWLALLAVTFALALEQLWQEWRRTRRSWNTPDTSGTPTGQLLYLPNQQPAVSAPADAPTAPSERVSPVAVAAPARVMALVRRGPRWFDLPLILLPLPLALAAAYLALRRDPLQAWHGAYLVAAVVAAPFMLIFLPLLWRSRLMGYQPVYRFIGSGLVIMLVVTALAQAIPIGKTQAHAYEQRGAYALALSIYADAGGKAGTADLERVHIEWAQAALDAGDYPTADAQVRALFTLDPATLSTGDAYDAFTSAVLNLGTSLIRAQRFDQALHLYSDARAFQGCAADCRTQLDEKAVAAYLLWAGALQNQGDFIAASDKLTLVTQKYASTPSAATAQTAIPEVKAQRILSAALAAGAKGDYTTMNAQLRSLAATYPHTAAAAQIPEVPQPATGVVLDSVTNASVVGDRLFFVAFATQSDARSFDYDFSSNKIVFVAGARIGQGGAFTARLQPGYWYVPCWDDPSQPGNGYFNAPLAGNGNNAFAVTPLTPSSIGTIAGY
ncbi:MAG: peptidase MA family metallohydrolase [Ktedonobacterales bacterium]